MDPYDFACKKAVEAGERAVAAHKKGFDSDIKEGNTRNIVTSADRELSAFLVAAIQEHFPGHAIYSEEGDGKESASPFMWALDPIDGTSSFARGIPRYCICIGLLENGIPLTGAVYDPSTKELFSFKKGGGAFLNGEPIHVSGIDSLAKAYITFSPGSRQPELYDWAAASYRKLLEHAQKRSISGSSALDLCYVACGRADAGVFGTLTVLDIASAVGILTEAGGVLSTVEGGAVELSPNAQRLFIANNPSVLEEIRTLVG